MSKRISNNKENFDRIDPQESLIKSLESIKSLLKQGDTKINQARENIARADSISSDSMDIHKSENSDIQNTSFDSSDSIQKPVIPEITDEQKLLDEINEDDIEEIVVEALPENNIFNADLKSSPALTKPSPKIEESSLKTTQKDSLAEIVADNIPSNNENTALNDLYDHDLIVPMLDEIIMPEDQNSSLFNMDSSVEIKLDEKLKSTLLELNDNDEQNIKIQPPVKNETTNSTYNSIKNSETNTKADIISFELNSNVKKNNLKVINKPELDTALESPKTVSPKKQKISLVENSPVVDQVFIKETTIEKNITTENLPPLSSNSSKLKSKSNNKTNNSEIKNDISTAIESAAYTDDALNRVSKSSNETIKKAPSVNKPIKQTLTGDEIDYSKIDGLDRLNFNADKMSSLQKRVEKRVHNRLIQLIVQLDDEIKNIFSDEIKNCIALELENKDKK